MTRIEFDDLVAMLEAKYQGRHPSLARKAVGYAILGYLGMACFFVVAVVLVLVSGGIMVLHPNVVTIKLGLLLGIPSFLFAIAVVKSLWVHIPPPEGLRLHAKDCPELFRLIDEIGAKAGGVRFEEILLVNELNASVVQIPRLGIFGWFKPYLILGLPLMDALTLEEFRSVVAHEFAHLSHQHGRLGAWLYRVRSSWERVIATIQNRGVPKPVAMFISWFWPRFNSLAFVLSRAQEYQADAFAAEVTSPENAARALQSLALQARRLDEGFWVEIQREVRTRSEPPSDLCLRMQNFLARPAQEEPLDRWLNQAFSVSTDTDDTHPGLRDRLAALGVQKPLAIHPTEERRHATSFLLNPEVEERSRQQFSREWKQLSANHWRLAHDEKSKASDELQSLSSSDESPDTRWKRLQLRSELEGTDSIEADLLAFLADHPDHPYANFFRGVKLAENDDLSAIEFLEKASAEPELVLPSLGTMANLYDHLNMPERVRELKERADQFDQVTALAQQERNYIRSSDSFIQHGLPDKLIRDLLSEVRAAIANKRCTLRSVWLVRKDVRHLPEKLHFVLVVDLKWRFLSFVGSNESFEVINEIVNRIELPGTFIGLIKSADKSGVAKAISEVPGALLDLEADTLRPPGRV